MHGPLDLIRMNWEDHRESDPESVIEYMHRLQNTLQRSLEIARKNLSAAQTKQKTWYDKKACGRTFGTEDEVLLPRPAKGLKLQLV